jgi:uncharacterized protein YcfJ
MAAKLWAVLGVTALAVSTQAAAQITFYQGEGYRGPAFTANGPVINFDNRGFNDRASSAIVERGRWQVCEDAGYNGRCVVLSRGSYPSLAQFGMANNISSVRPVGSSRNYEAIAPAPPPVPVYDYRRRPNESVYEVGVTSAHAVYGPPEQRCWVERQQVAGPGDPNVAGAVIGGILGGVLGHQVGGGRGRDVATVGGAVAGAAIGANVNRPGGVYSQDVQRCAAAPGTERPAYWEVTYVFRGVEHRAQLGSPPGPTIWVNSRGEPRG